MFVCVCHVRVYYCACLLSVLDRLRSARPRTLLVLSWRQVRMLGEDEDDGTRKPSSKKGAGGGRGGGGGGGKKGKGKGKGGKGKKSSSAGSSAAVTQGALEGAAAGGDDGAGGARVDFGHLCFEYHR